MNKTEHPQLHGHITRKDSIACGTVLASILVTIACGAFVVNAAPDHSAQYAQAENGND